MKAWIETCEGERREVVGNLHLGRGRENEIALPAKEASRRHALVCRDRAGCWLIDLDSHNGTWLNGTAVKQPTLLRDGDVIRIAAYEFGYVQVDEATRRLGRQRVPPEEQSTAPTRDVMRESQHAAALVDPGGKVLSMSEDFHRLMVEFFTGADHVLPQEVKAWFLGARVRVWPLVVQRGERRLQLRKSAADPQRVLVFATVVEPALGDRALEPFGLSEREREVLRWIAAGKRNEEIGVILGISTRTAEKHVQRLLEKLGAETRAGAVAIVLQKQGILDRV